MPITKELTDCRVLIVDDAKANVDLLVEALRGDFKLSVALDGEAALRAVAKSAPDLLLLDIMMPGIDGYEVCRRLRADAATRELPIMFLSSLEDVQDKALGFELGANDYLTKPFEILEVKARVRSLLKAKAYTDAIRAAQERDLAIAREIQMGILPSDLAALSRGTGLDIHATIEPARQVGGDLFEVLRVSEDRLVVAVGDVCGKGIPASLFMAVTVTLLRMLARQLDSPGEILARLNEELAAQNPRGMFVTMVCLDLRGGRVTSANAGHHMSLLVGPAGSPGSPRCVLASSGTVLGLFPGRSYASETLELGPGDSLVLYTDGVSEATNAASDEFGDERLHACFADGAGQSAAETVDRLLQAVRTFVAGAPQSDDITILAVSRTDAAQADPAPESPAWR
jgi:sigma-B regulation protein RsbU (phosphoserine phosphatase)